MFEFQNQWLEFIPPILYLIFLIIIVLKIQDKESSNESFFFASRGISRQASLISIIATETSVATVVIFPAVGYTSGLLVIWLCAGYIVGRFIVSYYILERIHRFDGLSLYGLLTESKSRNLLSFIYLLAKYISGGVRFYLAAYAMNALVGGTIFFWIIAVAFIVGLYSLTGGLRAVVITDQIQGLIIFMTGIWFCIVFRPDSFQSLSNIEFYTPLSFKAGYQGSILLFLGGLVITFSSHGADQDMLQRVFSVNDFKSARWSLVLSGFGASLVILIFSIIGIFLSKMNLAVDVASPLVSYIATADPLLKGLFLVLVLAASMSTLDSAMHATGAILKDIAENLKFSWLVNSNSVRKYSFLSLLIFVLSATAFITIAKNAYQGDFLGLAMGSMNYVNGGLIGILFTFVISRKPCRKLPTLVAVIVGASVTIMSEMMGLYWPVITVLSASSSTAIALILQYWQSRGLVVLSD